MARVREEVVIPKLRVAALIGKGGANRNKIAKTGKVSLQIGSDGTVRMSGEPDCVYIVSSVIEAVGRGFSLREAMLIFNPEYRFELLHISDFAQRSKKRQRELRGRLIGTDGRIKKTIEKKTKTKLAIMGKTVGIIGTADSVLLARRAVSSILRGAQYSSALGFLKAKEEQP